jgi:glutamyl-tRNA reductase
LLAREAGGLKDKEFLLVGVNEMTEAAGKRLAKAGAATIMLGNRTKSRGEELAREIGARQIEWDELMQVTARVDAVVTCTGAMEPVFRRADLVEIARDRPNRTLTVVDIAVPSDLDQALPSDPNQNQDQARPAHADAGLILIDLEDVGAYQQEIEQRRCQAAAAGEQIVTQMVAAFTVWLQNQTLGPKLERLRFKVERTLNRELERLPADIKDSEREHLTSFGRTLIKRFLGIYRRVEDKDQV